LNNVNCVDDLIKVWFMCKQWYCRFSITNSEWQKGLLLGKPIEHVLLWKWHMDPHNKGTQLKNWKQVPHHLCMQVHSYACLSLWEDVGESNEAISWAKASIYGSKIEFDDGFHKKSLYTKKRTVQVRCAFQPLQNENEEIHNLFI
jgi:hypothetical protein